MNIVTDAIAHPEKAELARTLATLLAKVVTKKPVADVLATFTWRDLKWLDAAKDDAATFVHRFRQCLLPDERKEFFGT